MKMDPPGDSNQSTPLGSVSMGVPAGGLNRNNNNANPMKAPFGIAVPPPPGPPGPPGSLPSPGGSLSPGAPPFPPRMRLSDFSSHNNGDTAANLANHIRALKAETARLKHQLSSGKKLQRV